MKAVVVESVVFFIAPDAQVYVAERGKAYALSGSADAFDRERAQDFLRANNARRLSIRAGNIKPVMKPRIFAFFDFAANLAKRRRDLARAVRRVVRPTRLTLRAKGGSLRAKSFNILSR